MKREKPDLEHINALDVIRFNNDIKSLINGETVYFLTLIFIQNKEKKEKH